MTMCKVRAQMCFSGEMTSFPRSNLKTLILKRKWQAGCGVILSPMLKLHEALQACWGPAHCWAAHSDPPASFTMSPWLCSPQYMTPTKTGCLAGSTCFRAFQPSLSPANRMEEPRGPDFPVAS